MFIRPNQYRIWLISNTLDRISPYLNDEVKDAINCGYSESKESIAKYLEDIYGDLINEMNNNPFIFTV